MGRDPTSVAAEAEGLERLSRLATRHTQPPSPWKTTGWATQARIGAVRLDHQKSRWVGSAARARAAGTQDRDLVHHGAGLARAAPRAGRPGMGPGLNVGARRSAAAVDGRTGGGVAPAGYASPSQCAATASASQPPQPPPHPAAALGLPARHGYPPASADLVQDGSADPCLAYVSAQQVAGLWGARCADQRDKLVILSILQFDKWIQDF